MYIFPVNASYAFHSMFESYGELRAYANLFILEPEREEDLRNPDNPAHQIAEMWARGSAVAARLGIVYLVAVMEAYATDVVFELLERRIRAVNQELLNQPAPTSEDEDIWNEIRLEEAELNKDNPFFLFAEITKEHLRNRRRQQPLKTMIGLLEQYFAIEIQNRESHLNNWSELQKLRNQIVHHRASSRKKSNPIIIKDDTQTLDQISVEKARLLRMIEDMHAFAVAIENGINSVPLQRQWKEND
jgi:hypothetical protein